jgi:hypothetical protein
MVLAPYVSTEDNAGASRLWKLLTDDSAPRHEHYLLNEIEFYTIL